MVINGRTKCQCVEKTVGCFFIRCIQNCLAETAFLCCHCDQILIIKPESGHLRQLFSDFFPISVYDGSQRKFSSVTILDFSERKQSFRNKYGQEHNGRYDISIYNAVAENIPLIRRIVTITGDCVKTPQNFEVRTGTNYAELVEEAGGLIKEPEKIISGGPMMGKALFDINVPVTKTSSAMLFLSHDDVAAMEPTACIRCGRCVNACPSHLVPQIMIEYAERNDIEGFKRVGGMECYECGSCTYVCPAKRRLTQAFAYARAEGRKRK